MFDRWGKFTNQDFITCDEWNQGKDSALEKGHTHALFIDSGTIFSDWKEWTDLLNNYPHQGLIGHIIWQPGTQPYLHQQCWFADITRLEFDPESSTGPVWASRSAENLHDDYTPLWIKPGQEIEICKSDSFMHDLIAQQLADGRIVANWNNQARSLKRFLYRNDEVEDQFTEYTTLAEQQLWVLNNESISPLGVDKIVTPGSGLFWMLNVVDDRTSQIRIIDISKSQVDFCQNLWANWNGIDYGLFAWDYIKQHNLTRFELDRTDISDLERLKLRGRQKFIEYVNERFRAELVHIGLDQELFSKKWQEAKQHKQVSCQIGNLIDWVLENPDLDGCDRVWTSNITTYKWTMLNSTHEELEKFKDLVG